MTGPAGQTFDPRTHSVTGGGSAKGTQTHYVQPDGTWVARTGPTRRAELFASPSAPRKGGTMFGGQGSVAFTQPGGAAGPSPLGGGAGAGGGFDIGSFADMFGGGGGFDFGMGGGPGAGGGGGAGGAAGASGDITLSAERSPDLAQAQAEYQAFQGKLAQQAGKVDQNLQYHIDEYKKRLGEGPVTRSIERAASAIRDQMAGMTNEAERAAAAGGRGPGLGAASIGESGQRALARAASDITLGRERDIDALVLGGSDIMGAPGRRELAYDTLSSGMFSHSPYQAQAQFGLSEKDLGLRALESNRDYALRQAALQQERFGTPMDWFRMLMG